MTYEMMIRAVPAMTVTIADKHASLLAALEHMPAPWGLVSPNHPPAPDPGRELLAEVRLRGHLGPGLRGSVVYRYRGGLRDEAMCDDFLKVEFDPRKQEFRLFLEAVFPAYVQAFGAYRGHAGDVRFSVLDFEGKRSTDARHGVFRIYPVNYFGGRLCQEAFGISPSRLLDLVKSVVDHVRLVGDGVLIVARSAPVELEEAQTINQRVWAAIKGAS